MLCLTLGGCTARPPAHAGAFHSPSSATVRPPALPIETIVIDAGHGGRDPGTSHFGLREKDLALDITRRLREQLQSHGISVVMTRDDDEFIALSKRPDVANRLGADLFVSVHINANKNRKVSGIEVYYPRESTIDSSAPYPPGIEAVEVAVPTMTVRQILWDLVLTRSRRQSSRMASQICRSMRDRLGVRCRGVKGARFVVLREARMPAVLVEVGYVSNQAEAARLRSPSYRQAVAQGIAEGIVAYARDVGAQHI